MVRLYFTLRLAVVIVASPLVFLYIIVATLLHPVDALRKRFRTPVRLWMSTWDWVKGIPVGYSYWERYQAPAMLNEIAVPHHRDRAS